MKMSSINYLNKDNLFYDKHKGDKIHYVDLCKQIEMRLCISINKISEVLNYYNNYLTSQINQGLVLNYPNLFYFGYTLKTKYANLNNVIQIYDHIIDITNCDNLNFSNLITQVNLTNDEIKHIIFIYNELFKQSVLNGYSISYLKLFYLTNKNNKINVLRARDIFYSKPDQLIMLLTNGNQLWLSSVDKQNYQIKFKFQEF